MKIVERKLDTIIHESAGLAHQCCLDFPREVHDAPDFEKDDVVCVRIVVNAPCCF